MRNELSMANFILCRSSLSALTMLELEGLLLLQVKKIESFFSQTDRPSRKLLILKAPGDFGSVDVIVNVSDINV